MFNRTCVARALCIAGFAFVNSTTLASPPVPYRGVNLSGAEFGGCTKEVKYGFGYAYPAPKEFDYFIGLGMNTFRLPFCWERLQKTPFAEFEAAELERLDKAVAYATQKNAYIVLDPHNYGRHRGKVIGSDVGNDAFADFWRRLAAQYRNNDHVIFGLMNEPHGIKSEAWLESVNASIDAIRNSGAKNLILVPGTAWTGAHSWAANSYGTPNAVSMLQVKDPQNNYAYEVHQYFDKDSSGTTPACVSEDVGAKRIAHFSEWLRTNRKKAFLGEFGAASTPICYAAVRNLLTAIHKEPQLWIGWTYWSAGAWLGKYMFALPLQQVPGQQSQLDVLKPFLDRSSCDDPPCHRPSPPLMNPPRID